MITPVDPTAHRATRERLRQIIFEADTPAGKAFDLALLWAIVVSVVAVMLESVGTIGARYGVALRWIEWFFTLLFTVEYALRLFCVVRPLRYAYSFFGVVDLLAILPTYLSLFLPGTQSLIVIRALRLLRIFRVLKLARYLGEANLLVTALRSSVPKVIVFLGTVLILALIMGTTMYLIEGEDSGFTSVPRSMYWAIVTMTTVGYGDIAPQTEVGQIVAAVAMIMGYSIIVVPTGVVVAEIVQVAGPSLSTRACPECLSEGHAPKARFCRDCGAALSGAATADAESKQEDRKQS
jgi:voltage-gated potassium channel